MRNYIPTLPTSNIVSPTFKPLWRFAGLPAERGVELTHFLRQGLSVNVLDNIQEWSGMSKAELLRISGINERNFARRKNAGQPLNTDESERIARLVRVFDAAVRLFNGDKVAANDWLNHPVKGLGHLRPIELIATESGALEVIDLIGRIEQGVFFMILYRLIKSDFAHDAWSGQGARLYGGRWNHKGTSAVYVSTQISLATLEILVHLNQERLLNHYNLFSIEISDKQVMKLPLEHLPDDWQSDPAPTSTMDIGTAWLTDNASVALPIPSCVIPYEYNAIINPNHPQFTKVINSIKPLDFSFDARLK